MKLEDRVDNTSRIEKLTGEQQDDFFTRMVMGKDVTEEIDTSRGRFKIKFPKVADHLMIGKAAAFRRNYRPVEAFDLEFESLVMMTSMLDVVVISGPKWFEDAKKTNKDFSFEEVSSREFIAELYGKARSFRLKVESIINKTEGSDDKPVLAEESDDDSVDSGAFGGLSSEPDDSGAK